MIEGIIIGSVVTISVIVVVGMIPMIKKSKKAEKKLKLKPGETFRSYPLNFRNVDQRLVYTIIDERKGRFWQLSQGLIDAMDDNECAEFMESLRKEE